MDGPTSPSHPSTLIENILTVVWRWYERDAASLLSPPPPPLHPRRITLCGRRALWRTCVHQLWGQGTTVNPSVFRARLSPCGFEEPEQQRCEGGRLNVLSFIFHETLILSKHMHTYTHRMYRCCSFLPHLFSDRENSGSTFSLWHWLPKCISDLASLSDFVSQNLPCFAVFPATAHQII